MSKTIEFPFSDPRVKQLVQRAYPGAKSRRTVKFEQRTTYSVREYWDGGSKYSARFLDLATMRVLTSESVPVEQRQKMGNPFNLPIYDITITPGFVVIEHCIFCGKDLGFRVYYNPELSLSRGANIFEPKLLTEGNK